MQNAQYQEYKEIMEKITAMSANERWNLIEDIREMKSDPITDINGIVEEIKGRFSALSTGDWESFCNELQSICQMTKSIWRLIDRHKQVQKVEELKAKIGEMIRQGYSFSQIRIDGNNFYVSNGVISESDPDDSPW